MPYGKRQRNFSEITIAYIFEKEKKALKREAYANLTVSGKEAF